MRNWRGFRKYSSKTGIFLGMFCLQDARACRRLTASPDSDAPTSPQSAPPSPQPAVTSSKQNAPSFGASPLLLEGPAITESKPDRHPAAASSSGNHAQASRVSHKNTEQIQALGTTAVFATSGAFAERTKLPSTPQNHPEKPTSIRRTAPFLRKSQRRKHPLLNMPGSTFFRGHRLPRIGTSGRIDITRTSWPDPCCSAPCVPSSKRHAGNTMSRWRSPQGAMLRTPNPHCGPP